MEKVEPEETDWYYKAVEAGEAVWLEPYYNGKIDEEVISYVVPIYQDKLLIGIAGMDILFSDITKEVKKIEVYENGMAYLINEECRVLYQPEGKTEFPITDLENWQKFIKQSVNDAEGKKVFAYDNGACLRTLHTAIAQVF